MEAVPWAGGPVGSPAEAAGRRVTAWEQAEGRGWDGEGRRGPQTAAESKELRKQAEETGWQEVRGRGSPRQPGRWGPPVGSVWTQPDSQAGVAPDLSARRGPQSSPSVGRGKC